LQQRESSFTDILGGKDMFVHDDITGSRSTEALHAQEVAALTHVPMPSYLPMRTKALPVMVAEGPVSMEAKAHD
jgi:hypothetical protein